jgi:hypothetical protein
MNIVGLPNWDMLGSWRRSEKPLKEFASLLAVGKARVNDPVPVIPADHTDKPIAHGRSRGKAAHDHAGQSENCGPRQSPTEAALLRRPQFWRGKPLIDLGGGF